MDHVNLYNVVKQAVILKTGHSYKLEIISVNHVIQVVKHALV